MDALQICYTYLLNTHLLTDTDWHCLTVNTLNLMMLWWLMKDCIGQHFCNAVVWTAELLRVKKKLEISLTTLF